MNQQEAQRVMDNMRLREITHAVQKAIDDMGRAVDIAHDMGRHDLEGQLRAARAGLLAVQLPEVNHV